MWKRLETWVRDTAVQEGAIYVVTGPVLTVEALGMIGANQVTVPRAYFKVIVDHRETTLEESGLSWPTRGLRRR